MSSWAQSAFELTQATPWLITLALAAFSYGRDRDGHWGVELSMTLYIKWSWIMQVFLWILESNYQVLRPDPYDPTIMEWAYPCEVAFWCFSLMTYVVAYTVLWRIKMPPFYWSVLLVFAFLPPVVLMWFSYNTWWEVMTSALLGIGLTLPMLVWMRFCLEADTISFMLRLAPWTWLGVIDTHLRTIDEIESAKNYVC